MDFLQDAPRNLFFTGKGGVGKTSVACATAITLAERGLRLPAAIARPLAVAMTFLVVVIAWVYFRAPDLATAHRVLAAMFGAHGATLPDAIVARLPFLAPLLDALSIRPALGGGARFVELWAWVATPPVIAFAAPNTQQIMGRYRPGLGFEAAGAVRLLWRPAARWAILTGALAAAGLLALNQVSEFLYFQF